MITTQRAYARRPIASWWQWCLGLLVVWCCTLPPAQAAPVAVLKEGEPLALQGSLDMLPDNAAIQPAGLLAGEFDEQFHRYDGTAIGLLSDPMWLRFRVANATGQPRLVLSMSDVLFTEASVFYNRAPEGEPVDLVSLPAGLYNQRIWQDWHYYDIGFLIDIPPDQMRTVYLKLHAPYPLLVNPFVSSEAVYNAVMIRKSSWGHLMVGLALGALLYLSLATVLMRHIRETRYCAAFAFVSFLILLSSHGYIQRILPAMPWLHGHVYTLLFSAQGFFYIALSREHFNTRQGFPVTDLLLRLSLGVAAALFFLSFFLSASWAALVTNVVGLLILFLLCITSVYVGANHERNVMLYVSGSLLFLFSAIVSATENSGLMDMDGMSRRVYETTLCLQAVLFTVALSQTIRRTRDDANKKALRDERARAENRAKNSFLAKMSHELRTPMNGLLGMVQLMERTPLNDQQQHYMQVMSNASQMLLSVIDDVLDYSRIVAGQLRLEESDFSLQETLHDIERLFTPAARQKALSLRISFNADNTVFVRADSARLRQILVNLTSNAIKFTEQGAVTVRIWVELCSDEQWLVHCEVEDTGIGMSAEQIDRLFQQYDRSDGAKNYGGSGLGLVICKQLVEMMGGSLHIESVPGYGSLFRFHIAAKPPLPDERLATPRRVSARHGRILVAEDDATCREVILGMLSQLGYAAECVDNGRRAVTTFCDTNQHWSLVLMDVEMPQLDGLAATQRIREWEAAHYRNAVPVVALTAHAVRSQEEKIRQAGMDDMLGKPVDIRQLQTVLSHWLPQEKPFPTE